MDYNQLTKLISTFETDQLIQKMKQILENVHRVYFNSSNSEKYLVLAAVAGTLSRSQLESIGVKVTSLQYKKSVKKIIELVNAQKKSPPFPFPVPLLNLPTKGLQTVHPRPSNNTCWKLFPKSSCKILGRAQEELILGKQVIKFATWKKPSCNYTTSW